MQSRRSSPPALPPLAPPSRASSATPPAHSPDSEATIIASFSVPDEAVPPSRATSTRARPPYLSAPAPAPRSTASSRPVAAAPPARATVTAARASRTLLPPLTGSLPAAPMPAAVPSFETAAQEVSSFEALDIPPVPTSSVPSSPSMDHIPSVSSVPFRPVVTEVGRTEPTVLTRKRAGHLTVTWAAAMALLGVAAGVSALVVGQGGLDGITAPAAASVLDLRVSAETNARPTALLAGPHARGRVAEESFEVEETTEARPHAARAAASPAAPKAAVKHATVREAAPRSEPVQVREAAPSRAKNVEPEAREAKLAAKKAADAEAREARETKLAAKKAADAEAREAKKLAEAEAREAREAKLAAKKNGGKRVSLAPTGDEKANAEAARELARQQLEDSLL